MDVSQIEVDRQVLRHLPGRRAQHAELHAAARARPRAQAGAAQARHLGDDRGVAAVGRVHPERRQHRRHPLRARHPHVRDRDAQHARHLGDSGRQEAEPPADHRRPEPRRRAPRHGGADGARGGRRRRRRPDHRGALRSGPRAERRRAVDVPGAVRSADGGAADHRAGDRPQHLPRAGACAAAGARRAGSLSQTPIARSSASG